ncbi:hypothetical protein RD279_004792 [Salmonella enterica]|nr:hypothetical protein [Salmonella enterica]
MIDMPPECPPSMDIFDVISIYSSDIIKHNKAEYVCFLQTPDDMKGNTPKGYPYFDFDAARKQNAEQSELQESSVLSAEMSPGEFYLALLLGGITFLAFAIGFLSGFIPQG